MTSETEERCERCGWPIVPEGEAGCWKSNCSMRPMPPLRQRTPPSAADKPQLEGDKVELLPCPGCGGTDLFSAEDGDDAGFVNCWNCGWNLRQKSKDEAEYTWSTRAHQPATAERALLRRFVEWDREYPKGTVHSKNGERELDALFTEAKAALIK